MNKGFGLPTAGYLPLAPMKAYFGTVVGFLPPSAQVVIPRTLKEVPDNLAPPPFPPSRVVPVLGQDSDQLYHIAWDDGDEQDYEEFEFQAARALADRLRAGYSSTSLPFVASSSYISSAALASHPLPESPDEGHRWTKLHVSVGLRVAAYFPFDPMFSAALSADKAAKRAKKTSPAKKGPKKQIVKDDKEAVKITEPNAQDAMKGQPFPSNAPSGKRIRSVENSSKKRGRPKRMNHNTLSSPSELIFDSGDGAGDSPHSFAAVDVPQFDSRENIGELTTEHAEVGERAGEVLPQYSQLQLEEERVAALAQRSLLAMAVCRSEIESLGEGDVSLVDRRAAYRCSVSKCVETLNSLDF